VFVVYLPQALNQELREGRGRDNKIITNYQETIDQLRQALMEERGCVTTLEEELNKEKERCSAFEGRCNAVLAECGEQESRILELESTKGALNQEIADLQVQLSNNVHNEKVWPLIKEVEFEDDESLGSLLLTPVKNYWNTPVKSGRSPSQSGWSHNQSGRSLDQSGRSSNQRSGRSLGVRHPLTPILFSMEKAEEGHQLSETGGSPTLPNSVPGSDPNNDDFNSILKELAMEGGDEVKGVMEGDSLERPHPSQLESSERGRDMEGNGLSNHTTDVPSTDQVQQILQSLRVSNQSLSASNRSLQERVVQLTQEVVVS
jgi:hypothetical protein